MNSTPSTEFPLADRTVHLHRAATQAASMQRSLLHVRPLEVFPRVDGPYPSPSSIAMPLKAAEIRWRRHRGSASSMCRNRSERFGYIGTVWSDAVTWGARAGRGARRASPRHRDAHGADADARRSRRRVRIEESRSENQAVLDRLTSREISGRTFGKAALESVAPGSIEAVHSGSLHSLPAGGPATNSIIHNGYKQKKRREARLHCPRPGERTARWVFRSYFA